MVVLNSFELTAYRDSVHQPGFTFEAPVSVTIHYTDWDVGVVTDEGQLTLNRGATPDGRTPPRRAARP